MINHGLFRCLLSHYSRTKPNQTKYEQFSYFDINSHGLFIFHVFFFFLYSFLLSFSVFCFKSYFGGFFCLFEQMCIFISRGSAPKEKNLQQNIFKHRLNTDLSTKRFGMLEMIEDQNSKP